MRTAATPETRATITPAPLFEEIGTGRVRVLRNAVTVHDGARGRTWTIAPGYAFDGPSIPRACAPVLDKEDIGDVPALPHDVLYEAGGRVPSDPTVRYTRAEADALFRDLMTTVGVAPWKRDAAYAAVREFGMRHWSAEGARP